MSIVNDLRKKIDKLQKPHSEEGDLFYDKYGFKVFLAAHDIRTPETYIYITDETQIPYVKQLNEFILKPNRGSSGSSVYNLRKTGPDTYKEIDGRTHHFDFIEGKIKQLLSFEMAGGVIIEEIIYNPTIFDIYNSTTGIVDLRLYMLDNEILFGKLRIPTSKSLGYANTSRKAIAMYVNPEGIIEQDDTFTNTNPVHPETKIDFEGKLLPHWNQFRDAAIRISKLFKIRFHSIDITIDSDNIPCVIESEKIPFLGTFSVKGCRELILKIDTLTDA